MNDEEIRYFYRNIHYRKELDSWEIQKGLDGKVGAYGYFKNLEDALHERDILEKYGWDYDLVVEDDTENHYYSMELPPFPQFRSRGSIRGVKKKKYEQLDMLHKYAEIIKKNKKISKKKLAKRMKIDIHTVDNVLGRYGFTWLKYKRFVLNKGDIDSLKRIDA